MSTAEPNALSHRSSVIGRPNCSSFFSAPTRLFGLPVTSNINKRRAGATKSWRSLEQNTKETIANSQEEGAKQDKRVAEFRRALDAGEMPPLRPITFSSDYNANDAATLLQPGGLEVLDVKTILALRAAESAIPGGV